MARYLPIDPHLFINNRKNLAQHLKPNSLVILNSADSLLTNDDGRMFFRQNTDLFYLSGIDQEETILVLYPDAPRRVWKEMLFVKAPNEHTRVWEGSKYTQQEAQAITGIANIYWLTEFETMLHTLMREASHVYLNANEHDPRLINPPQTRDARFIAWCQNSYPLHQYERLAPIMRYLRAIKSATEIDLIREACMITEKGFRALLPLIRPGMMEYEIEAVLVSEFIRHRSDGFAYKPIIGSGANSCVLHYQANNQACQAGTTILIDIGAIYAHYCADITRVIPVNGYFTKRQRTVYNAVLRVMRQAQQMLVPGNNLSTYHQAIGEVMEEELTGLGLLTRTDLKNQDPKDPAYKKYFMHGTSHHLGLNTHDIGDVYRKFEPGMVFTIEPGIYIPEEKLGIRLENDFVISENGLKNLTATMPIEAEEIEALMNPM